MYSTTRLLLTLLLLFPLSSVRAAGQWINPDLVEPEKKPQATVQPSTPAQISSPPLEGQLALEVKRVCDYRLSYEDRGSGGKIDGSFFLPKAPPGYYLIGGYAQGNYDDPSTCVIAVKPADSNSTSLLQNPKTWQRTWTDKGSGANKDGSIWHPAPLSKKYVCLGSVAHEGYKRPVLTNYACVHRCLVENVPATNPVWSTRGTGANQKVYVYQLHNSNTFFAQADKNQPLGLQDLKGDTSCTF